MRHGFERLCRCLEMPGAVVRLTGEQIDSLEQRRVRAKRSRILEDRQRFIKTPIVELELRKLEKTFGQRWTTGGEHSRSSPNIRNAFSRRPARSSLLARYHCASARRGWTGSLAHLRSSWFDGVRSAR